MRTRHLLLLWCVALVWTTPLEAQHLSLHIRNGYVTLDAREVTIQQILAEWARVGGVRVVNSEKIVTPPVTLLLTDISEPRAIEILLRTESGYVLTPRARDLPGDSTLGQIIVLPASASSRADASAPIESLPEAWSQPDSDQLPTASSWQRVDNGADRNGLDEVVEPDSDSPALTPSTPIAGAQGEVIIRPATPLLPDPPPSDPRKPFGSVDGSATPGVITPSGPPPGVVYPEVTNPALLESPSGGDVPGP